MKNVDITTSINGLKLKSCIMNASGALCSTKDELYNLLYSSSGAIVTKSCTKNIRIGNSLPRYYEFDIGSINSMGLPNFGIDFYLNFSTNKEIKKNKPIFLSISGLSLKENFFLIKKANLYSNISALELNLSCPNIIGKEEDELIYNYESLYKFLEKTFKYNKKPLGIKLPPFFRKKDIKNISLILNKFPISFITCINSIPNGICVDSYKESTVIQPNNGLGGIGGTIIKPFALSNIWQFNTFLRKDISIIGCGGIISGKDIFDHILCGASAVQIGTQLIKEGVSVFNRLHKELISFLKKKNYLSIDNFKGKLKTIYN